MKSIYMDENWGIIQQDKEKGEAITYVFESNGRRVVYPFIKRSAGMVNDVEYFDLATPRGQCGPWIENCSDNKEELVKEFNEAFIAYCAEGNIVAEYIRFSPWTDDVDYFESIYKVGIYGQLYCNDLTRDYFETEYGSQRRQKIRKAEKNDVTVIFDSNESSIDEFLSLYKFTESKYNLGDYYKLDRTFLNKYMELLPGKVVFVKSIFQGKTISIMMMLLGQDIAHCHFAANHPDFDHLEASSLLFYKASQYGARQGKKIFDMGGAIKGSTLEKFKHKFIEKTSSFPYSVGTIIRNERIYDILIEQAGMAREGYFPGYRKNG